MKRSTASTKPKLRCAVYTRKSSEEGLDQAFNSLHAQREACEAYIRSQGGEGWTLVKAPYDDGGVSGGTMERPGLQRLLADLDAGRLDVVVVYKVDRLTRSLADFAKMVERFDARSVSFVSVTQQFNTTTSMGRLTLNVLLSFAQFEREVTGERIRDKIAASKKKGMWMGGRPPLGYDLPTDAKTRTLVVKPAEADLVRHIFTRYLDLGSVHRLCAELTEQGIRSKRRTTRCGQVVGGEAFSRGALFHLLKGRVYLGEIVHKDQAYTGLHPPIVDHKLFEAVAVKLAANRVNRTVRQAGVVVSPLKGLVFDAAGAPMSPSFSRGKNPDRRYRYYVSADLPRGVKSKRDGLRRRAPAAALEALIQQRVAMLLGRKVEGWTEVIPELKRVEVHANEIRVTLDLVSRMRAGEALQSFRCRLYPEDRLEPEPDGSNVRLVIAINPILRGGRTIILGLDGRSLAAGPHRDPTLIKGLRAAHALAARVQATPDAPAHRLLHASSPISLYERRLLRLAFLAPNIQAAILEGRQPGGISLDRLLKSNIPLLWSDQQSGLGFPSS